ncbi:unnamed protein product [Polarella glacialis]|uniref:Palmitoyltransferase n=1 Tax=Polarella glacialis TaxID=89957 RepID=A0A813HS97_POLGL|nr:unnamed protein product [Polarella glacialis]|mmetsp:Transcript_51772/g.93259  ORF Transcript_51772/g.93259 Transcript_51772/m.93259 type:complete len:449 (-) Transcript_51772:138-1484(-)
MTQKLYGNNLVFCKGRFISGPDSRSCLMSLLMVLIPSIVWQVVPGVFFAVESSVIVPLIGAVLQLGSLAFMLATAFTDPGIMPRAKDFSEHHDKKAKVFRTKEPPRYHELVLRSHPFKLKYCTTCNIYRPPRCTHCSVCENCVERFDHHCPWLGNCIGKRNYWLFYLFVTFTGSLNVFVLATSISHLVMLCQTFQDSLGLGSGDAFLRAMKEQPLSAVLVVYSTGIVWFTGGLCAYHNYLVGTNQSTYEQIKGVYTNGNNPFDRGVIGNYVDILLSRVRPRYFNPYTGRLLWPRPQLAGSRVPRRPSLTLPKSPETKVADSGMPRDRASPQSPKGQQPDFGQSAEARDGERPSDLPGPRGGAQMEQVTERQGGQQPSATQRRQAEIMEMMPATQPRIETPKPVPQPQPKNHQPLPSPGEQNPPTLEVDQSVIHLSESDCDPGRGGQAL